MPIRDYLLASMLGMPIWPAEAGDPDSGKRLAVRCAGCHGLDGIGRQPMYPNIAGQKVDYLRKQLWAFKSSGRKDPSMQIQVRTLSEQDIDDLAVYYAGLGCIPVPPAVGNVSDH